ncbi:16S rRNA pseudouridine(516) synthase RsuA [Shewanella alkalitolerans]|uniref:16S rRNA pseudouridine(516) synthase RsuA n=1 Tax=Shewanella alkalitolerans TaxID=2864209 RepID=UPI001C65DA72|nr:16S rRNA pseudouridine(516) synthase RsuA [Shewanella alkalitolerans]QYJ96870.1 16S rRNA pseudouridine(516) synthase RsuA [Shewanella alkalitolerans]
MRLDKFISESTQLTRSLAKKALHRGEVTVDGQVIKDGSFKLNESQKVCLDGEPISLIGPRFIMLHKPVDTLCSTVDEVYPSVLNLLDLPHKDDLHIAGRLDADTTGLVLITSDGQWSHRVTSPKRECGKSYLVQLADPLKAEWVEQFATGLALRSEEGLTKPAKLELLGSHEARLTITEGKYHQVKRMFAAVGNKVVGLHRESVGEIVLDESLAPGEWRYLTEAEIASVK